MSGAAYLARTEVESDLGREAVKEIGASLRQLLSDVFALYLKTKSFHWHISGRHFRDYHLLLDEHAGQIFAMTDEIAERCRKIGAVTIRSIGDIGRRQRLHDNDGDHVPPRSMLAELLADNQQLTRYLRESHAICDTHNDVATASMLEVWIDQSERRAWFLSEILADGEQV